MAGFSFGGGASPFSLSTPAATPATTTSAGFSFSTSTNPAGGGFKFPGIVPTTSIAPAAATSNFNFNLNPSTTSTTNTAGSTLFNLGSTSTAAAPTPTFGTGGLNFGKVAAAPTTLLGGTPSTSSTTFNFAPPPSPSAVVQPPAKVPPLQAPSLTSQLPPASTASATTFSGFGFGIKPNASTTTLASTPLTLNTTPAAAAPVQPILLGSSTSTSLTTSTTTTSFGASGAGGATNVSMRQLEERLNKWLVELKEQEERFVRQASHVNAWDQILQAGHEQVHTLKDTLHTVKSDQSRLEAEIDFIRGQQEELLRLLDPLESATNANPTATQLHQGDRQRDNMYYLAQSLDAQLRQMTDDLGKVIEHLNTTSGSWQPNDPVTLVARILSAHMDTLKWVDQNTTLLSHKMDDVARVAANAGKRG